MSNHFHFLFPKSHQSSTKQRTAFEALEISHLLFTSLLWSLWALIPLFFFLPTAKICFFFFRGMFLCQLFSLKFVLGLHGNGKPVCLFRHFPFLSFPFLSLILSRAP